MRALRHAARGLLAGAAVLFLLTSALLCMEGDPCYLVGYGGAFLLSLPALLWAGLLSRIVAAVLALLSLWGFGQNLRVALDPARNPLAKARMLQEAAYGGQVVLAAEKTGYPADLPVATKEEYLARLIAAGLDGDVVGRLERFSARHVAFTIYRVSRNDRPETVFIAFDPGFPQGRVVIRKDGMRSFGVESAPPRQPQALAP